MEVYKVFECGLLYSPSGKTEWTIYWSDGSVTKEMRPCVIAIPPNIINTF